MACHAVPAFGGARCGGGAIYGRAVRGGHDLRGLTLDGQAALEGLKGVNRADVSFRDKEARVTFDPALVGVDQLIAAVKKAGFSASLKGSPR